MITILRFGFPPNMHVTTQADLNHRHHGITLPIRAPRPQRSDTDSLYTMPHFCVYCCRFAPWHVATSATHPAYHSVTMFIPVWYIPPRNIVWCGCRESNPERTTSLALRVCLVAPHPHNDGNGNRTCSGTGFKPGASCLLGYLRMSINRMPITAPYMFCDV